VKRVVGLAYAESIAIPDDGVIFIPGVGLIFKVGNPQVNPGLSPIPDDHIQTVKAYLKRAMRRAGSGRVGGMFTPVRARYSYLTKGWKQGQAEGQYKIVATDWELGPKGAGYYILWTPPATLHVPE
jgi:hypothetical protein